MGKRANDRSDKAQPEAVNLYRHIESWWGDTFDDQLIKRIVYAPSEHHREFQHSLSGIPRPDPPDEIPQGVIRPGLSSGNVLYRVDRKVEGLRLLLYAHEIVLDTGEFFFDVNRIFHLDSMSYAKALRAIMRMRPLVEDGSIKFAGMWRDAHKNFDGSISCEMDELLKFPEYASYLDGHLGTPEETQERMTSLLIYVWENMNAVCRLATGHQAHVLARTRLEQEIIRKLLHRPVVDDRLVGLHNLAALKVPTMTGDIGTFVKLRQSDADFAEWRARLGEALTYVGELGEGEESLDEAAEVVYAQLSDGLSQVQKAVEKSPALQAAKGGLSGLAISGITGTTAEVVTNDPSVALAVGAASGTAGMFLEAGRTYVKALQARRKGRLILDVAMLFDPSDSK